MSEICLSVETLVTMRLPQQQADLVDHHQLAGIGNRDRQTSIRSLFQRHEFIAEHQVDRDLLEQIVVQLKVAQVDELAAVAPRNIRARSISSGTGAGSGTSFPPFPPPTKTVFLSAIAITSKTPS